MHTEITNSAIRFIPDEALPRRLEIESFDTGTFHFVLTPHNTKPSHRLPPSP